MAWKNEYTNLSISYSSNGWQFKHSKCQYNRSCMKTTKASLKLLHRKPKRQWLIYALQIILNLQLSWLQNILIVQFQNFKYRFTSFKVFPLASQNFSSLLQSLVKPRKNSSIVRPMEKPSEGAFIHIAIYGPCKHQMSIVCLWFRNR